MVLHPAAPWVVAEMDLESDSTALTVPRTVFIRRALEQGANAATHERIAVRINLYKLSERDMKRLMRIAEKTGMSLSSLATAIVQDGIGTTPEGRVKNSWTKFVPGLDREDMTALSCGHNEKEADDNSPDLSGGPETVAHATRANEVWPLG